MRKVRLEDVCIKKSSNYTLKDLESLEGEYPVYGASGFIKNINNYQQENNYIGIVKDGAGIGRTLFLPEKSSVIGTMQIIIPGKNIEAKYLYYAIKNMHLEKYYSGSTIPHIYFKDYKKEKLILPDLNIQKHCVFIFDKLEAVIKKRQEQIELLDQLIKSRFVDMFGDPITNPKGWDKVKMSTCLQNIESGKSFVCEGISRTEEKPAILKLSAVTNGVYNPEENKAIIDKNDFVESAEVHNGDLLFTRKNTPDLVGMAAYVSSTPEKLMMPDLIFRLNTNCKCNKVFLWKLINHDLFRKKIKNIASGSAKSMSNISKARLENLTLYLPPIILQNQFADFVQQVDKSKFVLICKRIWSLEHLLFIMVI